MAYELVRYAPEFDPQIIRLQTHLWNRDPTRNTAYLRWKYAENPFLKEPLIQLALSDGRVVGMRGMFGALWEVDDTASRHLLPHADDFVVAPEHRNRGVAQRIMNASLADASRRGFPFAVALSPGPVTFVASLATGWRSAGPYQSVRRNGAESSLPMRLPKRVRHWYRRFTVLRPRRLFKRLDRAAGQLGPRISLSHTPRPQEMAELVARLPWDGRIRHVRDGDYFAWRFRNPLHDYRFLFWDDGALRGYLVLQRSLLRVADQGCVNIADWEASDEAVQTGLLDAALQFGRFTRVQTWTVSLREPLQTPLRDRGFEPVESSGVRARSSGLLVRRLSSAPTQGRWTLGSRDLLNIADWDLRILYSMAG